MTASMERAVHLWLQGERGWQSPISRRGLSAWSRCLFLQVTMTKPSAPVVSFGIKHSDYMTPLVVDVE